MNRKIYLFLTGLLLNGVSANTDLLRLADLSLLEGAITSITEGFIKDQTTTSKSVVTSQNPGVEQSSFQVVTDEPQVVQSADVIEDYEPEPEPEHHSYRNYRDDDHRSEDEEEYSRSDSKWDGGYRGRRPRYSGNYINRRNKEDSIKYQTNSYKGNKPTSNYDTYNSNYETYQPKVDTVYKSHTKHQSKSSYGSDKLKHSHHHYQSEKTPSTYQSEKTPSTYQSEKTPSTYQSEKTPSTYQSEKTPSTYQSEKTPSTYQSEKTPSTYQTEKTPSTYQIEKTSSTYQSDKTPSTYETEKVTYTTEKKEKDHHSPTPIYDSNNVKYESSQPVESYTTTKKVPSYSSVTDNYVSILPINTNYPSTPSYHADKPKSNSYRSESTTITTKDLKY